jgi:hypothetical protein
MTMPPLDPADVDRGRPLVIRRATVITGDGPQVLPGTDVLITGDRIAAVGPQLEVPDAAAASSCPA